MNDTRITAIGIQIEVSTYKDGKLAKRPDPFKAGILETDIPDAVMDWLKTLLPKEG